MNFRFKVLAFITFFGINVIGSPGAGILPIAKNPKDKKWYVLLSEEAFGKDKGTFADFGGKADKKDRNKPKLTALRETREESCGLYGNSGMQKLLASRSNKVYRITSPHYHTFLVKVIFDQLINKKFQQLRVRAKKITHKEKRMLQWVSLDKIKNSLARGNRFIKLANGKTTSLRPFYFNLLRKNLKLLRKIR